VKKSNIIMGFIFMMIAVFAYVTAASFKGMVRSDNIGPSVWPKFLCILLGAFSFILIIQNLLSKETKDSEAEVEKTPQNFKRVVFLCLVIGIFLILTNFLGIYIAIVFLAPISMYLLGERKTIPIVSITIGMILFIYLIFQVGLKVPLPKGLLFM